MQLSSDLGGVEASKCDTVVDLKAWRLQRARFEPRFDEVGTMFGPSLAQDSAKSGLGLDRAWTEIGQS